MKRIVKFENGKYGIRTGFWLFGYRYIDLKKRPFNWKINSGFIDDCQSDLKTVRKFLYKPRYKVIE
jgi:hypothetical protein